MTLGYTLEVVLFWGSKVKVTGSITRTQWHFISNHNCVFFTFARWRYQYYNVTTALRCHSLLARWRHWQQQYGVGSHSM